MDTKNYTEINTVNHHMGCKKHNHVNCEFLFVLSGTIHNAVGPEKKDLSIGDVCFMNTRSSHSLDYDSAIGWHRDLFISTKHLEELCNNFFDEAFYEYLLTPNKHILIPLHSGQFETVISRLNMLQANHSCKIIDDSTYIKCLYSIIVELLGVLYYSLNSTNNENFARETIIELINKLNDPQIFTLPIEDIVKHTNYSHSHFNLIFKREMGCSLKKYVVNLKLNHAKDLLAETNLTLSDIAYQLGYASQSHFTQTFKKYTGCLPTAYRKSQRKK